ncbi:hypothetical protein JCM11641_007629 [Rhodosporidiobolus odoratus]
MACTCRTTLSLLRQPAVISLPRAVVPTSLRRFSSSPKSWAGTPATSSRATNAPATSTRSPSSCPPGTVLKGLNYLKDGSDPIAKEDHEYPEWLWTLVDAAPKETAEGANEAEKLRVEKKELKRQRKVAIKAANSLKG